MAENRELRTGCLFVPAIWSIARVLRMRSSILRTIIDILSRSGILYFLFFAGAPSWVRKMKVRLKDRK